MARGEGGDHRACFKHPNSGTGAKRARRTQISLTEKERGALEAAAARTGRSLSALIRDAVDQVYGYERSTEGDLAAMRRAFGSWKHHELDGADWVQQRRSGSRLARWQS